MLTEVTVIKIPPLFYRGRNRGTTTVTCQHPKSAMPDAGFENYWLPDLNSIIRYFLSNSNKESEEFSRIWWKAN